MCSARCINKVMMEEKIKWEVEIKCEHSYDRRCARTLKTSYKPFQVIIPKLIREFKVVFIKSYRFPGGDLSRELCEELFH